MNVYDDHIVKDANNQDCDKVGYDRRGQIIRWQLWSEACNAWLDVPPENVREIWPSKYTEVQEAIYEQMAQTKAVI